MKSKCWIIQPIRNDIWAAQGIHDGYHSLTCSVSIACGKLISETQSWASQKFPGHYVVNVFLLYCRLNLIKRWLIIPRLTNPGSSTASFSPSLTPLMIRYVSRSLCSWHVLVKWILVKNNSTLFPVGGRCYLHDLHHRSAHRVCGHRADVQWPAQPQRQGCGQRTHEGLRYKTCLCCSSDSHGSATARYETLWPSQLPVNADMPTCWNDRCFFFFLLSYRFNWNSVHI